MRISIRVDCDSPLQAVRVCAALGDVIAANPGAAGRTAKVERALRLLAAAKAAGDEGVTSAEMARHGLHGKLLSGALNTIRRSRVPREEVIVVERLEPASDGSRYRAGPRIDEAIRALEAIPGQ